MHEILAKAITFATEVHKDMVRKVEGSPFILHPLEAGVIVGSLTTDEEIIAAALLHDTVEDTPTTVEDIQEAFGQRVAMYVAGESENKRVGQSPSETWKIRKEETLAELRESTDINVRILWLGDKLSNMRSMYRSYLKNGDAIFQCFNQKDKSEHAWYYKTIAEYLSPLAGTPAYEEYVGLVHKIFD